VNFKKVSVRGSVSTTDTYNDSVKTDRDRQKYVVR